MQLLIDYSVFDDKIKDRVNSSPHCGCRRPADNTGSALKQRLLLDIRHLLDVLRNYGRFMLGVILVETRKATKIVKSQLFYGVHLTCCDNEHHS